MHVHGPNSQAVMLTGIRASIRHMSSFMSCLQLSHRRAAENSGAAVEVHGPIPQADLLAGLGIGIRLEALLKNARGSGAADALRSGYARLSTAEQDLVVCGSRRC